MILFLQIVGALAAVALGMFLGGGRYTQTQDEIEDRLGVGIPRRSKRHFMWLDYFKAQERGSRRGRPRQPFKTVVAHRKDDAPKRKDSSG